MQTTNTQDIQYHEVKYIIDKTYEQRNFVRQKIDAFKECKADNKTGEAQILRREIKRDYALYKIYQRQMQDMYRDYLNKCSNSDLGTVQGSRFSMA